MRPLDAPPATMRRISSSRGVSPARSAAAAVLGATANAWKTLSAATAATGVAKLTAADRQAEARAAGPSLALPPLERLEAALALPGRDRRAVVGHAHAWTSIITSGCISSCAATAANASTSVIL